MFAAHRYQGRHRAPSTTGRTVAKVAAVGLAAVAAPVAMAGPAQAASDSTWDRLAQCEASGNWAINTGNGYSGGLQFHPRTWDAFRGKAGVNVESAHNASRAQQIAVAEHVLAAQGWGAWPACSRKLGIRGEPAAPRSSGSVKVRPSAPTPVAKAPQRPSQGAPQGTYTVRRGDTLGEIAAAHGTTWRKLYANNRGVVENPNRIYPGERLDV
jgi:hypothetical protein